MIRNLSTRIAHAFRRAALPLSAYYAVTLVLPLANGAAGVRGFIEHAVVVFVVPPIMLVLFAVTTCAVSAAASPDR